MDFTETSDVYTITGIESVSAPVNITNDDDAEDTENFFGNLRFADGVSFSNIRFDPAIASADIIDEDGKQINN